VYEMSGLKIVGVSLSGKRFGMIGFPDHFSEMVFGGYTVEEDDPLSCSATPEVLCGRATVP